MDTKEFFKNKYSYAMVVGGGAILASLIVLAVVIYPLYQASAAVTKEFNQKNDNLTKLTAEKKILDNLNSRQSELKKAADTVAGALPQGKDVGRLFIQTNELVKASGGTITGVSVSSANGAVSASTAASSTQTGFSGIQKYTFSLPVDFNSYQSMKNFINNSDAALRIFKIDDVSVSAKDDGSLNANMTITTYARN